MTAGAQEKFPGKFFDYGGAAFNVKHLDFGATGDGTTDDTTAIQAAIDIAAVVGGATTPFVQVAGTVFLPAGDYFIASGSSLDLKTGVRLIGAGIGVTTISHGGGSVPVVQLTGGSGDQFFGVEVTDLTIDGAGATSTRGILLQRAIRGSRIERVGVRNCDIGIFVEQSQTCVLSAIVAIANITYNVRLLVATSMQLQNSRLDSPINDASVYVTSEVGGNESVALLVSGCAIQGSQKAGLLCEDVNTVTVIECDFENNNRADASWGAIHCQDGADERGEVVNVIGSFFTPGANGGATSRGVHVDRAQQVNIIGSHIRGSNFTVGAEMGTNVTRLNLVGTRMEGVGTTWTGPTGLDIFADCSLTVNTQLTGSNIVPGISTRFVGVDATDGNRLITLTNIPQRFGRVLVVAKRDSGGNTVTVTPDAGLIDGGATLVLSAAYETAHLISDGTNWLRMT